MAARKWWVITFPLMRCPKCRSWVRFKFRGEAKVGIEKPLEIEHIYGAGNRVRGYRIKKAPERPASP